jgi:hypothetical protein
MKEPERVVGSEPFLLGRGFVAGSVGEGFHHGQRAAVGDLAGQHEFQAGARLVRDGRHHAEQILHGVAVAQAVAFPVVHRGWPRATTRR